MDGYKVLLLHVAASLAGYRKSAFAACGKTFESFHQTPVQRPCLLPSVEGQCLFLRVIELRGDDLLLDESIYAVLIFFHRA